jgi:uncharacterized protein YuzB (UPF0349 family)
MKIQICKKFSKVNKLQKKLEKAFPDDNITIKSCISMCKVCQKQPVAKVSGNKLKAQRIAKLIDKIDEL